MNKTLALLALLAGFPLLATAQAAQATTPAPKYQAAGETHAHPSPHGGVVHSAGAYHVEAVEQNRLLTLYLYDGKMQPLPTKQVTGMVLVEQQGGPASLKLAPVGDDRLQAQLPVGGAPAGVTVQLSRNGQPFSARFESLYINPAPAAPAAYACPMHPSETSATPGSCPKCHMALKKRS